MQKRAYSVLLLILLAGGMLIARQMQESAQPGGARCMC
jgi:hypothetical protein